MDESWRIPIGSMVPRRHSTEQERRSRRDLDPDDFRDVFGGPPRTVLLRRFSGDFGENFRPGNFYEEIFRPADRSGLPARSGRNLPGFRIPVGRGRGVFVRTEDGFYDDIFGSDGGDGRSRSRSKSKSKSKSKSNSSSVLSSEDLSPHLRPSIAEDAMLSSFASKLRPITIPTRRPDFSPPSTYSGGEESSHRALTINNSISCFMDFPDRGSSTDYYRQQQSHTGFSYCYSPTPETISLEPSFCRSVKKPTQGNISDAGSPSSVISSVFLDPMATNAQVETELEKVVVEVEEEGEAAESSFVVEIDSSHRMGESEGAAAVDEAIAWAKEKFWNQGSNCLEVRDETLGFKEAKGGILQGKEKNLFATDDGGIL